MTVWVLVGRNTGDDWQYWVEAVYDNEVMAKARAEHLNTVSGWDCLYHTEPFTLNEN